MDRVIGAQVYNRICELGSLSAAARALGISRPMVSRYLEQMEKWAGARLVNRSTRKLTLTAAVGYATTDYLDSRFGTQTLSYGIGAWHDLGNGYAIGLDLTRAQGTLISGEKASAIVISSSLTKKFSPFAKDEKKEAPKDKPAVTKS